jgi:opacity protein-like surface antigen
MKRLLLFVCIIQFARQANAQEIMLSGGLAMPLNPYSGQDILDNSNGHALNGYNFKLDYVILKQTNINFSLGLLYLNNGFDVKNIERQNNIIFSQKSVYTYLKPYTGLGFGASVLFYFTPLKNKTKVFSKISLGQLFVNSPEYSKSDSLEYFKVLSNKSNSIYWSLGAGIEYSITSQISMIGFVEYYYSKVDFGNIKISNVSGQVKALINTKSNEQALESLNFNIGLSYKFYKSIANFKRKKTTAITPIF